MESKKRLSRKGVIVVCVVSLLIGLYSGVFLSRILSKPVGFNRGIFDQVAGLLESEYLDTVESDLDVRQRLLKGLASGLGDPYTSYMEPQEADNLTSTINVSFVGIGVTYSKIHKGGIVMQVFKDSPAYKAGIKAGDIITHVNGNKIESYSVDKIKEMILGKPNTQVQVRVLRLGEYHDISIVRDKVEASLEGEIKTVDGVMHGLIKIISFGDTTAKLLEEKLKVFKDAGVEKIIIDLRGNPGGYLTSVKDILDLFIEDGKTLLSVEYKNEQKTDIKATSREKYVFKEGAVLINGSSASSSEVMAAAMQELLGYKLIGTKTFGKGIVQTQAVLSDNSTLKYTHARWLTPKGKCIHNVGIEPDVEVKYMSADDITLFDLDKSYEYDDVSEYVEALQRLLNMLGYHVDREDGYFSLKTKQQLQAFEKTYHLEVDGVFEQEDLSVLLSNLVYELTYNSEDTVYTQALEVIK